MMLVVPRGCQFYTLLQGDSGRVVQFGFGPANIVYPTVRQKLDTTAREWGMFTPHAWHYSKEI
jgi:hypothetical protein